MTIGKRIRIVRAELRKTQWEFAKLLNTSTSTVSNWERGIMTPKISKLKSIADLAGISVEELIGKEEKEEVLNPIINFYTLKDKLKQYSNEPMPPIYKSQYLNKLLDELKWATRTENTEKEMRLIGAITRELMQHCFKNGLEFEDCLALAMEYLENRGKEEAE